MKICQGWKYDNGDLTLATLVKLFFGSQIVQSFVLASGPKDPKEERHKEEGMATGNGKISLFIFV